MRARLWLVIALATALAAPGIASAASTHGKKHVTRHQKGYGFLPGYRPPEQIAKDRARRGYWYAPGGYWWYPDPGFYRGRWNGGGFGPCWTRTPIGLVWNCG